MNVSEIPPNKMTAVFRGNTPLQAKILIKEFIGLWIKASGIIKSIDDVGGDYVTFNFENDTDDVHISANFDKPPHEGLLVLNKGDQIRLIGQVFNIGEGIVVLDHCRLLNADGVPDTSSPRVTQPVKAASLHHDIGQSKTLNVSTRVDWQKLGAIGTFIGIGITIALYLLSR